MFRAVAVSLLFVCLFSVQISADCPTVLNPDDPPCAPNQYYAVLGNEPDWCAYTYGDWVFLRHGVVGGALTTTGWYVVPSPDGTSLPPSDFGQYAADAVGDNCILIQFP